MAAKKKTAAKKVASKKAPAKKPSAKKSTSSMTMDEADADEFRAQDEEDDNGQTHDAHGGDANHLVPTSLNEPTHLDRPTQI